jgi:hypothetical protein
MGRNRFRISCGCVTQRRYPEFISPGLDVEAVSSSRQLWRSGVCACVDRRDSCDTLSQGGDRHVARVGFAAGQAV